MDDSELDNAISIGVKHLLGKCFVYTLSEDKIKEVRMQLRSKNIVPKYGDNHTVSYLYVSEGKKTPFDGPSARLIYDIAVNMNLIGSDYLAVARNRFK
jgi:hypothetical protein